MKKYKCLFFSIILTVFACWACTPTIYDVPEEQWNRMTDEQRQAAIEGYNERERFREIERQQEAERRAREAEIREAEELQRERERRAYVEAIYRGDAGNYGDLIRVTMEGGEMKIDGKHRSYEPVTFRIADRERKIVEVISDRRHSENMSVTYQDGTLLLDESLSKKGFRIVYDQAWRHGKKYSNVNSESALKFRNVQISIEIIPHRRGRH